jgi:hypothetical protein
MQKVKINLDEYCNQIFNNLKSENSENDKILMVYSLLQEISDKSFKNGVFSSDGIQNELIGKLTTSNHFLQDSYNKRQDWLREAKKKAGFPDYVSFDIV